MSKRPRTEMDSEEGDSPLATPAIIRSPDIWFFDGSIILQAENTQFKAHQAFLARHSTVFADLFSLPQPEGEAKVDGCPVVVLHDSAEDIRHMLLALYDRRYHSLKKAVPFDAVSAMIRMGRKYDIEHLREEGVARLELELPRKLSDARYTPSQFGTHIVSENGGGPLLFKIINLALEVGIQSILPQAYFMCLNLPMKSLLRGFSTVPSLPNVTLSREAQEACLLGLEEVRNTYNNIFFWVDDVGSRVIHCQSPELCEKSKAILKSCFWRPQPELKFLVEPWDEVCSWLDCEETFGEDVSTEDVLCSQCLSESEVSFRGSKAHAWECLPSLFDLPQWSELKDFGGA